MTQPDRRKPTYDDRLHSFFRKVLIVAVIFGMVNTVGLGLGGLSLYKNHQQGQQIQKERYNSLIKSCGDQNKRHDDTINEAETLPADKRQVVTLLVDKLQPYQPNCVSYARSRVKG